jgi:hypothetical protein
MKRSVCRALALSLLFCAAGSLFAGNPGGTHTVTLRDMGVQSDSSQVFRHAFDVMAGKLRKAGVTMDARKGEWTILLKVNQVAGGDQLIVTAVLCHSLPNEVIDLGKKAEVMYTDLSPEKKKQLPAEGKWVREMVSEEYVRQFVMPMDAASLVVAGEALERSLQTIAERFCEKYINK